jgi:hypothetical protein
MLFTRMMMKAIPVTTTITTTTVAPTPYDPYWSNIAYLSNAEGTGYTAYLTGSFNSGIVVSTTNPKFGAKSLYFNGVTTTYQQLGNGPLLNLSTGDFTVEGWFNLDRLLSTQVAISIGGNATGFTTVNLAITVDGSVSFNAGASSTSWVVTTSGVGVSKSAPGTVSIGTWFHAAIVRNGSVFTLYFNGNSVASFTSSATLYNGGGHRLGTTAQTASPYTFKGYMDEIRITKGIARYTSNFQVPTEAFPTNRS